MNVPKIGILAASSLFLLAACTGQPEPVANSQAPTFGSTTPTVESSQPPSSEPPGTPPPSPEAPPPAPAAADRGDCKAANLKLSLGASEGAAGTIYRQLVFTNTGTAPCILQGFPGVSYVTGDDGHQVGPAAVRSGDKGEAINVAPGASAAAPVGFREVRNYDEAVCKPTPVRGLRVYPPQETASMFIALEGTGCAGNPPGEQLVVKTIQRT